MYETRIVLFFFLKKMFESCLMLFGVLYFYVSTDLFKYLIL